MCFANELNPLVDLICIKCMCLRKFCMNIGHGAQSKKGSYDTGLYKLLGFCIIWSQFSKTKDSTLCKFWGEKCTNVHYVQIKETGWSTNLPSDLS